MLKALKKNHTVYRRHNSINNYERKFLTTALSDFEKDVQSYLFFSKHKIKT